MYFVSSIPIFLGSQLINSLDISYNYFLYWNSNEKSRFAVIFQNCKSNWKLEFFQKTRVLTRVFSILCRKSIKCKVVCIERDLIIYDEYGPHHRIFFRFLTNPLSSKIMYDCETKCVNRFIRRFYMTTFTSDEYSEIKWCGKFFFAIENM